MVWSPSVVPHQTLEPLLTLAGGGGVSDPVSTPGHSTPRPIRHAVFRAAVQDLHLQSFGINTRSWPIWIDPLDGLTSECVNADFSNTLSLAFGCSGLEIKIVLPFLRSLVLPSPTLSRFRLGRFLVQQIPPTDHGPD